MLLQESTQPLPSVLRKRSLPPESYPCMSRVSASRPAQDLDHAERSATSKRMHLEPEGPCCNGEDCIYHADTGHPDGGDFLDNGGTVNGATIGNYLWEDQHNGEEDEAAIQDMVRSLEAIISGSEGPEDSASRSSSPRGHSTLTKPIGDGLEAIGSSYSPSSIVTDKIQEFLLNNDQYLVADYSLIPFDVSNYRRNINTDDWSCLDYNFADGSLAGYATSAPNRSPYDDYNIINVSELDCFEAALVNSR